MAAPAASERCMSYREVLQNEDAPLRWKEITVATGSGEDEDSSAVKLSEVAGGYAYRGSGQASSTVHNRALYWRAAGDVLDVVEVSLDVVLVDCRVRFRFSSAVVAAAVAEGNAGGDGGGVALLVATRHSVHRLVFPAPQHRRDLSLSSGRLPSVLGHASSVQHPSNVCHLRPPSASVAAHRPASVAAAWQTAAGDAIFALGNSANGNLMVVRLPPAGATGLPTQYELCQASLMQRLWSGFIPTSTKVGQTNLDACVSLAIHTFGHEAVILSMCRDAKLRVWSTKSHECVLITNLLNYVTGDVDPQQFALLNTGGRHVLKKSDRGSGSSLVFVVYLSLGDRSQFSVFDLRHSADHYELNHLANIFSLAETLVDFCVTSNHIWTLGCDKDLDTFAHCAAIFGEDRVADRWLTVFMAQPEAVDVAVPAHLEPREAYLTHIFTPGRFTAAAITRALNIYRRSLDVSQMADVPLPALKAQVSAVLEHEIQSAASEYEMEEEEFHQLQLQQWSKFYSCCVQYYQRGTKPLGLFASGSSGMVILVKKDCMSFIRPTCSIEHFHLLGRDLHAGGDLQKTAALVAEQPLTADLTRLYECIRLVGSCVSADLTYFLDQDLYYAQSPHEVVVSIADSIVSDNKAGPAAILAQLEQCIRGMTDMYGAVNALLNQLDLASDHTEDHSYPANESEALRVMDRLDDCRLLSSPAGVSLLSTAAHQVALARLGVATDLLLLLTLLTRLSEKAGTDLSATRMMRADVIGRASTMVQAYYVLKWAGDTLVVPARTSVIDASIRQLDALDISEQVAPPVTDNKGWEQRDTTLLSQFVASDACRVQRHLVTRGDTGGGGGAALSRLLMSSVTAVLQSIWPMSAGFRFPEFLLRRCQYEHVQDYVRLTRDWCEWNVSAGRFLLAHSYLNTGEADKAMECFLLASHGLATDDFLVRLLETEVEDETHAEVVYYLKVIRLFEQFPLPHLVITLARTAISVATDDDPHVPTLWSKIFKYHLEVGHNEEAYTAMISNPDASRRKDCLRQFLVVLCERSQLQTLVELPYKDRYVDLEEEVVNILMSRARSIDLTKHSYYDLLYSFHVFRGNFRKAGSVMYEYGVRIGQEVGGLRGLQKQAKCYLATLNSLRLVDPKYAWIVKPVPSTAQVEEFPGMSPKHSLDGEECSPPPRRQVELLVLDDVEKEYLLVHARLQLLQKDPDPSRLTGPTLSAVETVALMVNGGLLDSAVNICRLFGLPLTTVFEGLTARCVSLAQNSDSYMPSENQFTTAAWNWLQYNDLSADSNSTTDVSLCDQAWHLLQRYLVRHESDGASRYHRCVTVKLLTHAFQLPDWLTASYKVRNAAELLRLYLDYDLLSDATDLTMDYIDAVLGKGKEYFGLQTYLHCGAPPVWLPYTCIDQLLVALGNVKTEAFYTQLRDELQMKLDGYLAAVVSVSADTIAAAHVRAVKAVKLVSLHSSQQSFQMMDQ